jgi:hypothetical protein
MSVLNDDGLVMGTEFVLLLKLDMVFYLLFG